MVQMKTKDDDEGGMIDKEEDVYAVDHVDHDCEDVGCCA